MKSLSSSIVDLVKGLIAKEPARLVGYGSSLAVAGALKVAELLGVTVPADVLAAISLITGFVISELIRRFVYSPATTQIIANSATSLPAGSVVDIGAPPTGEPMLEKPYTGG